MRKKGYVLLVLIGLIFVVVFGIYINKPNENDFVQWFKKEYDIKCIDADCSTIEVEGNTFGNAEGYYDSTTGFFATGMQIKRLYRNINDPNQFFSIAAKGFFGDFEEIEFIQNKVDIKLNYSKT